LPSAVCFSSKGLPTKTRSSKDGSSASFTNSATSTKNAFHIKMVKLYCYNSGEWIPFTSLQSVTMQGKCLRFWRGLEKFYHMNSFSEDIMGCEGEWRPSSSIFNASLRMGGKEMKVSGEKNNSISSNRSSLRCADSVQAKLHCLCL
jgi:hypothetical protein